LHKFNNEVVSHLTGWKDIMAGQLYKVVFEGEILEGSQVQEVKRALARLYNTTEDQVERFFSGKRLAVKKDVDYDTAMKYVKAFDRAGAVCRAEAVEPHTDLEQPLMLEKDREESSQQEEVMVCPKCQFEQEPAEECLRCGIIISKYSERLNAPESERRFHASESEKRREDTKVEPQPRGFRWLPISVGLLMVFLVAGFYYFSGTPRYSLYKIGRAFKNHDSEEFHKYVDVDRIVDHLTKYAVEQALAEMEGNEPTGNWGGAGQQFDKELAMMMLPAMIEALKPQIRQAITDLIEDRGDDREGSPFIGASLAGIETEGTTSMVTVQDEDTGQEIRFKMVKTPDRYWKIVEIDFESFQAIADS
jgi:hypothetical protein